MNNPHPEPTASHLTRITAGSLLIVVPASFMAFFTALQMKFDYPDILRKHASEVLTRFAENQGSLLPLWYGMFAAAVLFIPLSVSIASLHTRSRAGVMGLGTLGMLAGLVQAIGLSRWVFAVPSLASRYVTSTSAHERESIALTFDTLNSVMGVGIGEHLGYLLTTGWSLWLAWSIRATRPITAIVGALSAAGIAAGLLEPAGVPLAGMLNALGYTLWSLWLVWLGALCLWGKRLF